MTQPEFNFDEIKFSEEPKLKDPIPKSSPVKKTTRSPGAGRPTKQSKINEMQEEIEGFLMLIAMPLKMRDVHDYETGESCADLFMELTPKGVVLTDQAAKLANALAVVGVDNKYISKFFDMGDGVSKWLMLLMAVQPFVVGMYGNHVGMKGNKGGYRNDQVG